MYNPASPGALSPDVPSPFARVEGVGDRRENVGRITFYVMAMVKGTVPGVRGAGGTHARTLTESRDTPRTNTDITLHTLTNLTQYQTDSPMHTHNHAHTV
jgi:hypothetical protein